MALGGAGIAELDGKLIMAGGETRAPDAARPRGLQLRPGRRLVDPARVDVHPRHGLDLVPCGNGLFVTGGMAHFGATNVNDTGEAFTLDGSPRPARSPSRPRACWPAASPASSTRAACRGSAGPSETCPPAAPAGTAPSEARVPTVLRARIDL